MNLFEASHTSYSEADFDGISPAPLRIVGPGKRQALIANQDRMGRKFVEAAYGELGGHVKDRVVRFTASSIIWRMHQREALNGMNYMTRLYETPRFEFAPEGMSKTAIKQAIVRARNGGATPFQSDVARRVHGAGAAELLNWTEIGEFRSGLDVQAWEAMSELVGRDAQPDAESIYKVHLFGFDRDISTAGHIGAMRVGMKQFVGHTDDGASVKVRTGAVINTSPSSGFDQDLVTEFREAGSREAIVALPSFQNAVRWLVDSEVPSGIVLARNETGYAEHADVRAKIAQRHPHLWV